MRPIDELTQYAYGLLEAPDEEAVRIHLKGCAACATTVEGLRGERQLIAQATEFPRSEEPPAALLAILAKRDRVEPPRRLQVRTRGALSWAGLSAAAFLLGLLVFVLFRGHGPGETSVSVGQASEDSLNRLIAELKSPSPVHRELALSALKTYGEAAVGKLKTARIDPQTIDACRGITPAMRAIEQKLDSKKVTMSVRERSTQEVLDSLRTLTGLPIVLDWASSSKLAGTVSLEAKDESVGAILRKLLAPMGLKPVVTSDPAVLLTDQDPPMAPARMPLRIPGAKPLSEEDLAPLANGSPETRQLAEQRVRSLGFAAESSLWKGLDGNQADLRASAAELLRALYTAKPIGPKGPLLQRMCDFRIMIDLENASLTEILAYMSDESGINFVIDPAAIPHPKTEMVSFKVVDINLDGALRLLLQPRQKSYAALDDVVVITGRDRIRSIPPPPFWGSPAEVLKMETLLGDLISSDRQRSDDATRQLVERGMDSLGPLREAEVALTGSEAQRCRTTRLAVEKSLEGWFFNEPSGADLETLSASQRRLLARRVSVGKGALLKESLDKLQVKGDWRTGGHLALALGVKDVPLGPLLRAVLRPSGLDFRLEGETLVVDEAAKINAARRSSPR